METIIYPNKVKANKNHRCNYCLQEIEKGSIYLKSLHKNDGDLYQWKSHISCDAIADKLKMFDNADDGVTDEIFIETIKEEYSDIMSEHFNEIYESKDFVLPKFAEKLKFVLDFHKLSSTNTGGLAGN